MADTPNGYFVYIDGPLGGVDENGDSLIKKLQAFQTGVDDKLTSLWANVRLAKTAAYTLLNADKQKTIALGGSAFYTLTVGAASGFDSDFAIFILNEDTARGKLLAINGLDSFFLYPQQTVILYNQNNVWKVFGKTRWRPAAGTTVYVATTGNDANDGLASGGPLLTPQAAINRIKQDFDLSGVGGTPIIVQLADGTYSSSDPVARVIGPFFGSNASVLTFPSAEEVPVLVRGNLATPANVVLTSSANGLGTCMALIGGCFGIEGVKITSTGTGGMCLQAGAGIIIYGDVILGTAAKAKIYTSHGSVIESFGTTWLEGNQTDATSGLFHSDFASSIYITDTIQFLGNITGNCFAASTKNSSVDFVGVTIDLNSFTFTGRRFITNANGAINTGSASLTFLPGTIAGINVGYGSYDTLLDLMLPTDRLLEIKGFPGSGTGSVKIGTWAATGSEDFGAIYLNGENNTTGGYNFVSSPGDKSLYVNRPSGNDIIYRLNNVTQMILKASGNLKLAGTAVRGTTEGTNHLDIFNGTAPVGTLANGISIYSSAGECYIMDAGGTATLQSPHASDAPAWMYDDDSLPPNISKETNCFGGTVRFVNFTRQARLQQLLIDGVTLPSSPEKRKIIHEETYEQYNTRMKLSPGDERYLTLADWDEDQESHYQKAEQARDEWSRKSKKAMSPQPEKYVKRPRPLWLKGLAPR